MVYIIDYVPVKTNRLLLKQTSRDDIELILKMDKQEDTQLFLGGIKDKTREERLLFLDKKNKIKNSLTVLIGNIPIGFAELTILGNVAEVSYIFDSDYTGNGYCSEVIAKLVEIAFEDIKLDKLYAYCKKDNFASQKVLLKNSFIQKGFENEFLYYELERLV